MRHAEAPVWVSVISAGRAANVAAMQAKIGPATWYVSAQPGEADAYRAAGAAAVVVGGGLSASRNQALREAWAQGLLCAQVSDDMGKILYAHTARRLVPLTFAEALGVLAARLEASPFHLAGVAPTNNAYFFNPARRVTQHGFCVGDLLLVRASHCWFDARFLLKEDYDFTLQHLTAYAGVVRCNDLLADFAHRANAGGAVAARTPQLERAMILALMRKWPGSIRPNRKRANEVLLIWPPRAAVLDPATAGVGGE